MHATKECAVIIYNKKQISKIPDLYTHLFFGLQIFLDFPVLIPVLECRLSHWKSRESRYHRPYSYLDERDEEL